MAEYSVWRKWRMSEWTSHLIFFFPLDMLASAAISPPYVEEVNEQRTERTTESQIVLKQSATRSAFKKQENRWIVLGVCVFLLPVSPGYVRAAFMPVHVFSGLFIFTTVIATALMGITEKLIFGLKNPSYKDSPPEATFVNVLGLLITVFGALILWIATRPNWKRPSEQLLQTLHNEPASVDTRTDTAMSDRPDSEPNSEARKRNSKTVE